MQFLFCSYIIKVIERSGSYCEVLLQEIASVKSMDATTPRAETEQKLEKAQAEVTRLEKQVDRMLDSMERKDKQLDELRAS